VSTVSVNLPESLHRKVEELARGEGISVEQFIASATAEKMAALVGIEYLEERAARGSQEKFEEALSQVPDVEPEDFDRP
jgi:predicted transcriptional regulator